MSLNISNENNADFRYQMNDLTALYYGARCTYQELLEDKATNFKLKRIVADWILREVEPDTTLESHFYYMEPEDRSYLVYDQLRVKLRCSVPFAAKTLFGLGREETRYREEIIKLEDLARLGVPEKKERGILIREVQISKLGLMTFTI